MSNVLGRWPLPARTAYLWWEGSWSLMHSIAFTLSMLYQVQVAHLSPGQLMVVGAAMEASCFLFEIPTSIVADLYSRRLSALIGAVVVGSAILLQGFWASFWPLVIAQVIWGLGFTFISGAVDAWITDEVGADAVQPLFTRFEQQHLVLGVLGIVLAGLIGHVNLHWPMLIGGTGYLVLAAVMTVRMPETGFVPTPRAERENWAQMKQTFITGVHAARKRGVVRSFMVIAVIAGISSEVFDRLWTARVVDTFALPNLFGIHDTAGWFTVFALIGSLIALVASLVTNKVAAQRVNALHPGGLLAALTLVQVAGVVGFALLGSLWPAMIAMWVRKSAQTIAAPVQSAWLQRNVDSRARATTISLTSQADALGQVVGGPPLGALAGRTSIPFAMVISAVLLTPAAALFARLRPGSTGRSVPDRAADEIA
ncbi:MFS transporter [Flexivirga sp. B27]